MKRIIKFRAISMCKGEHWLYGDLIHYNRNTRTEKWTIRDPKTGLETDIDETTIGQFTGLCDKNGKEIYEGDIVIVSDWTSVYASDYKGTVCFERGQWVVSYEKYCCKMTPRLFFDDFSDRKTTIIGNKHDNPGLLIKH